MNAPAPGVLRIDDVVKHYGRGDGAVAAVEHCTLEVAAGEICVVVGPSGCGKTSLLHAIAGFHDISGGSITLDGELLCGPGRAQAEPGADRVVVFQHGALFPWKTNVENVAFGPIVQGRLGRAEALEKARAALADAGLVGVEDEFPGSISSGMRRRVEIVRALMNEPKLLLLDEPFRALDSLTKSLMHEALLEIYEKNRVTIFFITHDLDEAIFLGDKVVVMTTRPCRPKQVIEVDLPRPRTREVLASARFRELLAEAQRAVHEEAARAFASGEREG
jgi:NitT/TauT family transport system ATP-binding protein